MAETAAATILLDDLPDKALVGVDLLSFTTTPKFKGIRNLPPGWHFVFASSDSALSVRHGAWFHVKESRSAPPQIFVKKWDRAKEHLVEERDTSELLRWRANLGAIWRERLTPYRQHVPRTVPSNDGESRPTAAEEDLQESESQDWTSLTSNISDILLTRITGGTSDHWTLNTASSAAQDLEDIPGLTREGTAQHVEEEVNFLPVDLKRTWRPDATGRERTDAARDRSWALKNLVENHCNKDLGITELLGELQFCFLMILTLNNYSCLEQWKRLLQLVLTCTEAVQKYPDFFVHFLQILKLQLQHCQDAEGGLIDLSDEGATLLKSLLQRFKSGFDEISGEAKVRVVDELDELEDYMRDQHGWYVGGTVVKHGILELEDGEQVDMDLGIDDADDETGEYAPVVVDLSGSEVNEHAPSKSDRNGEYGQIDEEEQDLDEMDARY